MAGEQAGTCWSVKSQISSPNPAASELLPLLPSRSLPKAPGGATQAHGDFHKVCASCPLDRIVPF